MSDEIADFTIVGAGLAGTLLACHLGKAGHRVEVYEKRADPRSGEQAAGRSINLAISVRGIQALREVGLADEVLRSAIRMSGRMIHAPDGALTFQPYGNDESESIHSISRAGLNLTLVRSTERYPSVRFFFQKRCTRFDLDASEIELVDEPSQVTTRRKFQVLIGADGAYSAVRQQLQSSGPFNFCQEYLPYGYKEIDIPAGPGGAFRMEQHALHIWPRRSFMMIALPNLDGSFTGTLFWPLEGPGSFAAIQSEDQIRGYFAQHFADAVPLLPSLVEAYRKNPVGSLVTMRCQPWHLSSRVVLLGDAAHAVVPFLGQGMNAAFEDCTVLSHCLAEHPNDLESAFRGFESRRKVHTDALAEMCVDNFVEMRDKVGSKTFLLKKKLENALHAAFPRWYLPLYTMISFTTIPYASARQRARRQNRIALALLFMVLFTILAVIVVIFARG
jgi:kynurenine 3-monooxygenase